MTGLLEGRWELFLSAVTVVVELLLKVHHVLIIRVYCPVLVGSRRRVRVVGCHWRPPLSV